MQVELRRGGLEAYALLGSPPIEINAAADTIVSGLRQAGVRTVPDAATVAGILSAAMADPASAPNGVLVAVGEAPSPGVDAQLLSSFPVRDTPLSNGTEPFSAYPQNVAYPGDTVLRKNPPSEGIPGTSLLGAPVPAPGGRDITIMAGDGIAEDGSEFRATTYGVILFHKGRLQVVPALRVSEDRMEARLTLLPDPRRDLQGHVAAVVKAIQELGVRQGIDCKVISEAVERVRTTQRAEANVLVARGREAVDGQEAGYRFLLDLEKKACKVMDGDRVDFREIESVRNVTRGEALAERLPPLEPLPGYRVDGEILKPRMRRATGLRPGDQTALSEDGQQVVADADGMVLIKGGQFHVVDSYVVPGDVDFSVGNIRASGSVQVRGQVKPGFVVQAGKIVEIGEDVWEARLEAGGDVKIRGGIAAGSLVKAGNNLTARYVSNSRVEVGGDMDVSLSVAGSEVYVKGKLRVNGAQGRILGGEVNAAAGVEAREIGAPSSRTRIVVGVDLRVARELEALEKERSTIPSELASLHRSLGKEFLRDAKAALLALPPALRKAKLEVLQQMQELRKREGEIQARLEELNQFQLEAQEATIRVSGEIHAETQVTVYKARTTLSETLQRVILHYDAANGAVVWRRL